MQSIPFVFRSSEAENPRDLHIACDAANRLAWLFTRFASQDGDPSSDAHAAFASQQPHCAIGEIISAEGAVSTAWLAGTDEFGSDPALLAAWHGRAVRRPGRFVAAAGTGDRPDGGWSALLSWPSQASDLRLAFFMRGPAVPAFAEAAIGSLLNLLTVLVTQRRDRADRLPRLQPPRADRELSPAAWLGIAADILWESNAGGVLRCRRVLNGHADSARALDGVNLANLRGAEGISVLDLLKRDGGVRNLRVETAGARQVFFFNAETHLAGDGDLQLGFRGTASADCRTDNLESACAALARSRDAHRAAEDQRNISENLFRGLRLMLETANGDDKLAALVGLIANELHGADVRLVSWGFGAREPMVIASGGAESGVSPPGLFAALDAAAPGRESVVLTSADGVARTIRDALGMKERAILIKPLASMSGAAFLVCGFPGVQTVESAVRARVEQCALVLRLCLVMRRLAEECGHSARLASLGHLAMAAVHEIRQPLGTIAMVAQNLELLAEHGPADGAVLRKKAERLLAQVERARGVADRLRRFGHPVASCRASLSLRDIVEDACDLLAPMLSAADIRVETHVSPQTCVHADAAQLELIFVSLLQNVAQTIGSGDNGARTPSRTVRISASETGQSEIAIRIENDGTGFPVAPPQRGPHLDAAANSGGQDAGFGMAVCEALVRENHGTLEAGILAHTALVILKLPQGEKSA